MNYRSLLNSNVWRRCLGGWAVLLFAGLGAPAVAWADGDARHAKLPDNYAEVEGIVAIVGDQIIMISDLRRAQGSQQAAQAAVPTDAERPRNESDVKMQTLQALIDNALVLKASKELGLSADEHEVDRQIAQTRQKNSWSEEEMLDAVRRIGFVTLAAYRQNVRNELVRMEMLKYKIGSRLRVMDEEVKKVIEQEHGGGTYEEELHARHILVLVPADAKPQEVSKLREKAWHCYDQITVENKPFEQVAADCSDDTGTGPGGDLGWSRRWTLEPTFGTKLWSLKKGEVSTVIQTPYGFHVIQLLERRRAPVKDKDVLEQFVRARLNEAQFVRLYRAWIEELRAATHIEVRT